MGMKKEVQKTESSALPFSLSDSDCWIQHLPQCSKCRRIRSCSPCC